MNELLPKEKLVRFGQVVNQQSDNIRFADKLYERVKDAESILVKDPTGLRFYYFPKFEGETDAQALAGRPVAIPKAFVEKFDEEAIKEAAESEVPKEVDLESTEHLKAQVKAWIDTSVLGEEIEYTEDDLIRFISAHGTPEKGKFIVTVAKNGKLDSTARAEQKRFSSERTNIQEKIKELAIAEIVVNSANFDKVRKQLSELFTFEDGKNLFQSDIVLPMTHMRDGQTYIAEVSNRSFDYFGQLFFTVMINEEGSEGGEDGEIPGSFSIDSLKIAHSATATDPSNRYLQKLNINDNVFITFTATGITKPVKLKITEMISDYFGESGVLSAFGQEITVKPGVNVIPTSVRPVGINYEGVVFAITNKEADYWQGPLHTDTYAMSRNFDVYSPAIVPTEPVTLDGPSNLTLSSIKGGVAVLWTNYYTPSNYNYKSLEWSCDEPLVNVAISDVNGETSVSVKADPAFTVEGSKVITVKLQADNVSGTHEITITPDA